VSSVQSCCWPNNVLYRRGDSARQSWPSCRHGPVQDIIHNHDTSKTLFLGLRYHTHTEKPKGKIGSSAPGAVEITLAAGDRPESIFLRRLELFDFWKRPFLNWTRTEAGKYKLKSAALGGIKPKEQKAIRETKPMNFLFSSGATLRALSKVGEKPDEEALFDNPSRGFSMYISALSVAFGELGDLFRNLTYVGPLREHLRRYYPIASEMPASVGSRGEHMANLARRRLLGDVRRGQGSFQRALNNWIERFEFGTGLAIQPLSDELFSLSFRNRARPNLTNIADTGFGASQVLPLIVQALAAPKGSLTIAEQPEIHLNPRLQYLLADLFAEMASSDHRVIVETHSEHLLLRLRRLVASGKIGHEKVAIYFVEKRNGVSRIRHVPIQQNGHISSEVWPEGFFEESLRESLALAAAQSEQLHKN